MNKTMRNIRRLIFSSSYLFKPRWDTGIPVPELVRFIEGKPAGKAIDIGCGTGTNLLFLAQNHWQVTGLDFARLAIRKAKRKLAGFPKTLRVANVTKMAEMELPGPYDLALDLGCFHSLSEKDRDEYRKGVERWIKPGGSLLIYAFQPAEDSPKVIGLTRQAMERVFTTGFDLTNYEQGKGQPSAWYYFTRREK
jgi:cyclopropane fatty-acyl-phospholipid synthase-like methyltransferase